MHEPTTETQIDEARETMAEALCRCRRRRGWTQDQLARHAALSTSYISMLERGERSLSVEGLAAIARALSVSPAELLRGEPEPSDGDDRYRKLVGFARAVHLTRDQVERLIQVGLMMFG